MIERVTRTLKVQSVHCRRLNQQHAIRVMGNWIPFYTTTGALTKRWA